MAALSELRHRLRCPKLRCLKSRGISARVISVSVGVGGSGRRSLAAFSGSPSRGKFEGVGTDSKFFDASSSDMLASPECATLPLGLSAMTERLGSERPCSTVFPASASRGMSEGVGSGGKLLGGLPFDGLASLECATSPAGLSTTVERFGIRAVAESFRSG